jgi:flagellar protein FlbD
MVSLTRLNGSIVVINSALIESLEETPDTVITLTNEHRYIVRESVAEVIDHIIAYQAKIYAFARQLNDSP